MAEGGQRDRGDGRHGGDHRGRLSAYERDRRRRLLADRRPEAAACASSRPAGGAGAKATIASYREKGYDTIPSRGPLAALTVPGAVGGFALAFELAKSSRRPPAARRSFRRRHAACARRLSGLALDGAQRALRIRGAGRSARFRRRVPHRRQAAESRRRASSSGARRHAGAALHCRARRFLPRRCRARDRRRSRDGSAAR